MIFVVLVPLSAVILYYAIYAITLVFIIAPYCILKALFTSAPAGPEPEPLGPIQYEPTFTHPTDLVILTESEYNRLLRQPLIAEHKDRWLTSSAR